jgi:single-strand DNA-binding protein
MTINEVILAGRLTKDPEIKYTQSNTAVCKFAVALDRYMGEGKEKQTDFINCTAWGKQAEFVGKYFGKGRKIIIKGNLKQNVWTDNDDKKHYDIEVWVEKVDFADSAKDSNGGGNAGSDAGEYEGPREDKRGAPAAAAGGDVPPWMK